MLEPREFDLEWEGRRCIVNELGAEKSLQVARRLTNLVGEGVKVGGESGVLVGLGAILTSITDEQLKWFCDTFEAKTLIEADPGTEQYVSVTQCRDLVFGGKAGLKRRLRWLQFCIDMSCGDFLDDLRQKFQAGIRLMAQMNQSPSTSARSGSSTGSQSPASTETPS